MFVDMCQPLSKQQGEDRRLGKNCLILLRPGMTFWEQEHHHLLQIRQYLALLQRGISHHLDPTTSICHEALIKTPPNSKTQTWLCHHQTEPETNSVGNVKWLYLTDAENTVFLTMMRQDLLQHLLTFNLPFLHHADSRYSFFWNAGWS